MDVANFFKKFSRGMEYLHHLYVFGAFASVIYVITKDSNESSGPMGIYYLVAVSVYLLIILILLIANTILNSKKVRYAEAIHSQHQAIHLSRNTYRYLDCCHRTDHKVQFSKAHFTSLIEGVLTAANSAFEISSGVKCRTSIKLIGALKGTDGSSLDHMYVSTLARDAVSKKNREMYDKSEGTKHILSKNSDFSILASMKQPYFFNGDISKLDLYENTSNGESHGGSIAKLSYNSAIVFPIRYVMTRDDIELEPGNGGALGDQVLYGFFTVDSLPRNSFSERYDIQLGGAMADALFPVLDMYRKVRALETSLQSTQKDCANL